MVEDDGFRAVRFARNSERKRERERGFCYSFIHVSVKRENKGGKGREGR